MTDFEDWIIIAAGAAAFLAMVALLLSAINGAIIGTQGSRANQAQCESIGGRYDGEACWYNGEKVDVNKYVEEWK